MDFLQITVLTTTQGSEIVSEQLIQAGSSGTMIEDRADVVMNQRPEGQWDIIDEAIALRMGEDVRVSGYYPLGLSTGDALAEVRRRIDALSALDLGIDLGKLLIESAKVEDEDWAEYWKKSYVPFRLGRHMLVVPSWTSPEIMPDDKVIRIDPGMAFGTGTHETTGLCVQLVEAYVKHGDCVIDVGTGTGILAIAACHMGARSALAIDIDPVAVRVAAENIKINGLEAQIRTQHGDLLEAVDEQADVVIANIIADVIIMIAASVRAHIVDGGLFICSGIARERQQSVIDALNAAGYKDLDIRNQGEWAAIACRK